MREKRDMHLGDSGRVLVESCQQSHVTGPGLCKMVCHVTDVIWSGHV